MNFSKETRSHLPRALAPALSLITALSLVAACGGDSGGGSSGGIVGPGTTPEVEPNEDSTTATALALGTAATGDVTTAGDVDFFQLNLTEGAVISIELRATRLDQAAWDAAPNVARLTVYDTDGTTKLLEHDFDGNFSDGWSWGAMDLDIPMFEVPADGTYFVAVTQDDQALAGGAYALYPHTVSVTNLQEEAEPFATSGANDTPGTAEAITPGTVHGYHVADEDDFYTISVTGPTKIHLELTAYRNGVSREDPKYYDPYLYLYDTDGTTELISVDDAYFYDSAIEYTLTTAGIYYVRVYQFDTPPGGPGGEYFLTYAASPVTPTAETEPNDDTATADAIAYGGVVAGDIDTGEVDFYRFQGTKGDMVRLQQFDGLNLQGADDTVVVTLLESDGVTTVPTGGGAEYQVQTTILQTTGTYYIMVEPDGTPTPTGYGLVLTRFQSSTAETEANDTIATADFLVSRVMGAIDPAGDEDFFSTELAAGKVATFACYGTFSDGADGDFNYSGHGSDCFPEIEVQDSTGTVLASSTSQPANGTFTESSTDPLPTTVVSFIPATAGLYYLHVTDGTGGGGPTFYYVIDRR